MADLRPWRVVDRHVVFSGGPVREVAIESVQLPDGRIVADYYGVRLPDYVLVFAELEDGRVAMLRQYKHGPRRVCLTFPGGAIEAGEAPIDAARRELMEEIGCSAQKIDSLGTFVTNANQGCNTAHLFRATGCRVVAGTASGDLEEAELQLLDRASLLDPDRVAEIGLATHVTLLLLATRSTLHAQHSGSA
jgi:ADP-ribose pyrophosphatase